MKEVARWYLTATRGKDTRHTAFVLGPFTTEEACAPWFFDDRRRAVIEAIAAERSPKATYVWGMTKVEARPGKFFQGILNGALEKKGYRIIRAK